LLRRVNRREKILTQLFADLGLMADLTRAVADQGYTQPTPVQMQAIPAILSGRDVLAGAQTGTGKTAGFTLPLLQRLMTTPPGTLATNVRALVVTPTRELAAQVEESMRTYGKYLPLRSTVVFGGVGIGPQIDALKEGVEILVATPGRLLDHAHEQTVDLSHVEILVLDEADRMLDMGFIHDVKRILSLLPAQRQNLLFSATFSDDIRELAAGLLHDPVNVEAAPRNSESILVTQRVHPVGQERKRALLAHLVKSGDWKQVLVFTRSKHGANRLAHQLGRSGISATAIHGNKSQGARTKALADFKAGAVRVLVATDLAARGLDIEELPHVVNYDLPHVAEDYVHRIGRTGRAGNSGEAISLVSPEEKPLLSEIEKLLHRTVEQIVIPGFEPGIEPPPAQARPPQQNAQPQPQPRPPNGDQNEGRRGRRRNRGRNRNRDRDPQVAGSALTPGAEVAQPQASRQESPRSNGQRQDSSREDRDNRGNRDISPRKARQDILDDDFGNRIQPVKPNRSIRMRIAMGDIDEELDNIGNRLPPPKNQRALHDEDEINYNVAPPVVPVVDDVDDRQPMSNVGQLFPSSAGFMGDGRPRRGIGGHGRKGSNAAGAGNGQGNNGRKRGSGRRRGRPQQGQAAGQAQGQRQPQQQRQGQKHAGRGGNGNRQQRPDNRRG